MKLLLTIALIIVNLLGGQTKIAVLGNSISVANWTPLLPEDNWTYILQEGLGDGYKVHNFARGGMTIFNYGKYPLKGSEQLQRTINLQPEIVIFAMGSNDSHPGFWDDHSGEFIIHYQGIIARLYDEIPNLKTIYFCYPPWHRLPEFRENIEEMIPMIDMISEYWKGYKLKTKTVDWYYGIDWDEQLDFCDDVHICKSGLHKMGVYIYNIMKPAPIIEIGVPANLMATHIDWGVLLEWESTSDPELESFVVYRGDLPLATEYYTIVQYPNISFFDENVQAHKTYFYQVSAIANGVQSEKSDIVNVFIAVLGLGDEWTEEDEAEQKKARRDWCIFCGCSE